MRLASRVASFASTVTSTGLSPADVSSAVQAVTNPAAAHPKARAHVTMKRRMDLPRSEKWRLQATASHREQSKSVAIAQTLARSRKSRAHGGIMDRDRFG